MKVSGPHGNHGVIVHAPREPRREIECVLLRRHLHVWGLVISPNLVEVTAM
ncbi:hypothetical protein ACJMK2_026496, partial [Sinanodonta woodiana]